MSEKRIKEMENILDKGIDLNNQIIKLINDLNEYYPKYLKLRKYYGSKNYFKDLELDNKNKLPDKLKRGVLSEDGVSDYIGETFNSSLDMIEIATKYLRNY